MSPLIITESSNPKTTDIDLMNSLEIAQVINLEDMKVAHAIQKVLPQIAQAIDAVSQGLSNGGRMAYFGAGTSGRLGVLDASEIPPTFGASPELIQAYIAGGDDALRHVIDDAEDKKEFAFSDLQTFAPTDKDIVVVISASGNALYGLTVLKEAQKIGCTTIAISSNPLAKAAKFADIFINPIVGQEVITGSSRLKSGTAQKMILNMISTGAMIRIGKTYKNYMIDVQQNNKKLIERSIRFITEICGISKADAQYYLEAGGNCVKTACVMAIKKCTKEEAEKILARHNGILRKVI